jgi:hypothetical protein
VKQSLPTPIADEVHSAAEAWSREGKTARLFDRDKTLWTNADEDKWLGWLDIADRQLEKKQLLQDLAHEVKSAGYRDAVVPGMGGSKCMGPIARSSTSASRRKSMLRSHLNRLDPGDYFALPGYIQMNAEHEGALQKMRLNVRDSKRVATCGFGPRFLHSTRQAYKGGPNTDVVLQITCDDAHDIPIRGRKFTFGTVKAAQARGDFDVLAEKQRRALRVHLPSNPRSALATLGSAIKEALS